MKTSIEWLKEYSDIDVSLQELSDRLTMTGSKVEGFEQKGNDIKNVVIGKILEIEQHPDADKLVVTKVDVKTEIIQIVTGAKNIKVNDIIPVAKDGSELPDGVKIKKGALRGIESCGMMCSIHELGLSEEEYPEQNVDGIMILDKNYENDLGKEVVDVLNLKEDIVEFEITSNRPDCLSIEGLGREVAVSLNQEFKNPRKNLESLEVENKTEIEGLKVKIENADLCYRYVARVVKNVKIGNSPDWMKRRLKAAGMRSINNIVDITNYVMLELGQPMHAFDIKNIDGKEITVRNAKENEKIITLDEQERTLSQEDLVIADQSGAVAIAGVMGGMNSGINEKTEIIVFESANFYGGNVRKTAKRVGLRTESSSRFEKGLPQEICLKAINRAIELIEELGFGESVDGKIDIYPTKQKTHEIKFEYSKINGLLGTKLTNTEIDEILEKIDIKSKNGIAVAPNFRVDLETWQDLSEEVARFYGYDKLDTSLMKAETTVGLRNKEQKLIKNVKDVLVNSGFSEIYTYGFLSIKDMEKSNILDSMSKGAITIKNPLSDEYKLMRPTTVPSMMQIISTNINKKNLEAKLFDVSRNYKNLNNEIENGEVPLQEDVLTIGVYGDNEDFYTLKGNVENILESIGINRFEIEKEKENKSYHPGRTANIKVGIDIIGTFGEVHPKVLSNYDVEKRVYLAEINISKVVKYSKTVKKYVEIPKFPAVERDLAIVVDEKIQVGEIEKLITKKAKKQLESIKLFDIYRSEKLGESKKSIAYSLIFRDKSKTLSDDEITKTMNDIIESLQKTLNAEIRGVK